MIAVEKKNRHSDRNTSHINNVLYTHLGMSTEFTICGCLELFKGRMVNVATWGCRAAKRGSLAIPRYPMLAIVWPKEGNLGSLNKRRCCPYHMCFACSAPLEAAAEARGPWKVVHFRFVSIELHPNLGTPNGDVGEQLFLLGILFDNDGHIMDKSETVRVLGERMLDQQLVYNGYQKRGARAPFFDALCGREIYLFTRPCIVEKEAISLHSNAMTTYKVIYGTLSGEA